ncbi:MAG: D-alanyl-D-alanine carboxypeptidase/D-alanyl-D-alanine-endopeptidase, partial [Nitrospinaceae bacterium]|nr:D-alanyl-D-alanine carboxypeptidase/D-alanyl-D-alanine-endopeptidase [Nitrospinaceae bacterium]NIR56291.1 D-alanyl-D-alanine carboxypeptidase/D-alanyl-D-alanine-endopeptidase [Nitrospinaceae bacterium]NIS86748.1 D-alanyl-D-alanine carboxypeptidase/D-alanyl-D-alanine-endopeptidase [Nitrospinaceae bacterium]NIT83583.1 D-alanyl-D-alanine carboxypeptidase/D-alanyl-D-alanine-endopeptidase [Nitrospinaceae bacterium]NIU45785.1 D-alanyl-D-alanine carboxypeptidase/D-alanyl-D-alanine-endopeptidase [Ni
QILKTLGAEVFGPPGTTRNGVKVLRRYLDTLSLDRNSYTLVDGSGLSPQNRLSPHQIVQVLRHVQKNLSIFPEFIAALGVMGVDGNVKRRMNGLDDAQRVRVKTGTLKGVSALSGFFQSKNKELFAFSILMNDLRCHNGKAWSIQDQIVREGLRFQR